MKKNLLLLLLLLLLSLLLLLLSLLFLLSLLLFSLWLLPAEGNLSLLLLQELDSWKTPSYSTAIIRSHPKTTLFWVNLSNELTLQKLLI